MTQLIQISPADRRATAHLSGSTSPRRHALGAAGAIREACAPIQNALNAAADLALAGGRADPEAVALLQDVTARRAMLEEAIGAAGQLLERRGAQVLPEGTQPLPAVPAAQRRPERAEGCTCPAWRPCRNDLAYGAEE